MTVLLVVSVPVQVELLLTQSPVQPLKVLPGSGTAMSVTTVPVGAVRLQTPPVPQAIPVGKREMTAPVPVPAIVMVMVTEGDVDVLAVLSSEHLKSAVTNRKKQRNWSKQIKALEWKVFTSYYPTVLSVA